MVNNAKRRAEAHPEAPPAQVIRIEYQNLPAGVLAELPERYNMTKAIQRQRLKNMPTNPRTLEDLGELPENFKKTSAGDNFLLYDSREHNVDESIGRILIFATRENLQRLARSEGWYVDGTFKVVPSIFFQLFTILGTFKHRVDGEEKKKALPLVYALLTNKTQAAYEKVFEVVNDECLRHGYNIITEFVMTDFEMAIINAVEKMDVVVKTCFFHLRQSLYRRIQQEGLQEAYNNPDDRSIKEAAQMMCATAFVPVEDVEEAFDIFMENCPDDFTVIADYFEINYIRGKPGRGRRKATQPRYAPALWNM